MAVLSGAVPDATAGTISRSLVALGLSEIEAARYEGKVREANILLAVHTDDVGDIARARDIFEQAEGRDICTTAPPRKDRAEALAERSFST
jgi:hypothetical protein